jgi:tungstate transport system permease protein
MDFFFEGLRQALRILFPPSRDVLEIVGLSLVVSGSATVLAAALGTPLGLALSLAEFRGKRLIIGIVQTALSVPAVLIGLVVYILVSRRGLLGFFGLLFTPGAMILAQALLAFPIVTALTLAALKGTARDGRDLAYSLGASRGRMLWTILRQNRFAFLAAMITGF